MLEVRSAFEHRPRLVFKCSIDRFQIFLHIYLVYVLIRNSLNSIFEKCRNYGLTKVHFNTQPTHDMMHSTKYLLRMVYAARQVNQVINMQIMIVCDDATMCNVHVMYLRG